MSRRRLIMLGASTAAGTLAGLSPRRAAAVLKLDIRSGPISVRTRPSSSRPSRRSPGSMRASVGMSQLSPSTWMPLDTLVRAVGLKAA
jgi:hypothetical protein